MFKRMMHAPPFVFSIILIIYAFAEYYGWQAIKTAIPPANTRVFTWAYWTISVVFITVLVLFFSHFFKSDYFKYFVVFFLAFLFFKVFSLLFLLPEDITRLVRWVASKFSSNPEVAPNGITRSQFLSTAAVITAAIPTGAVFYGAIANAYNYQYRKVPMKFPNLPDAFNGYRIIQISDIHSGSFGRTQPLIDAVQKINNMNADVILFTGDLVNDTADEMEPYMHIFDKLQSKGGVYSTTGNHDYGDYHQWSSPEAKKANFERFKQVHKELGWRLLMNEHVILERDGQKIALIGIENYGAKGHFKKYGRMDLACPGTENIPFKILMSHDPSHWDAQVRPQYPDIDLTLSGHTHGFQFGIENKWIKWSPSQWMYKQWADKYQEGKQVLYVNRGFGFIGYPGRVGILPEVTEITLLKG